MSDEEVTTLPEGQHIAGPAVIVPAAWVDPVSGATYVHKDLEAAELAWENAEHIGPVRAREEFGDAESWAAYVKRYAYKPGDGETDEWLPLLTWNRDGLRAVIDYHSSADGTAGRCEWVALCPFDHSTEWKEWTAFANGAAVPQKTAVEKLEELADDILEPDAAAFLNLLRALRASASATAVTELRPDGTTAVKFESENSVRAATMNAAERLELPPSLTIGIPVLRGDVDRFRLTVRLRVSVDQSAHLSLRFSIQGAERVLEQCYAERVAKAQALLGDGYQLLRGA